MVLKIAPTAYNPALRREKLEQAILFFLHHANNEHLGRKKLMKLLYYADFDHYERYEQPITGARYRKLDHGPVPDDANAVIAQMVDEGRVFEVTRPIANYRQMRLEPAEAVNLSVFTSTELATLYDVANRWRDHSGRQIEEASHGEAPWLAAKHHDVIEYHLAYYRNYYDEMSLDEEELALMEEAASDSDDQ